jgi:hypothetical protein
MPSTVSVFQGASVGDTCRDCRREISLKDWTCPHCGRILDSYLFSTVTAKSVSGPDKDAFLAGYQACMDRWTQRHSVGLEDYRPTAGRETAYRAGWKHACDKIEGKAERKRGRRRGLQLIGSGVVVESIGLVILFGSPIVTGGHVQVWYGSFLAGGIISIVIGIVAVITGASDE